MVAIFEANYLIVKFKLTQILSIKKHEYVLKL